jgi:hypothetical protein
MLFAKPLGKLITKLEKLGTPTKLALIAIMSLIAVWLVCKKVSKETFDPQRVNPATLYRPVGLHALPPLPALPALPASAEHFEPEVGCLKQDGLGVEYESMPFYQMACKPETQFNLPLDARLRHQPLYDHLLFAPECHHRHPMDTLFA